MKVPTEAEMQAMRERLEIRGSSLWWKVKPSNNVDMYKLAGSKHSEGYQIIRITAEQRKRVWFAHHIAYFLHHGVWPTQMLDHKDQDKQNNDPKNLRLATDALNKQNTRVRKDNTSGIKGVFKTKKGFTAHLVAAKTNHQKRCSTLQEAIDYRKELEKTYHPWSPNVI